jgi:hypothetical protein
MVRHHVWIGFELVSLISPWEGKLEASTIGEPLGAGIGSGIGLGRTGVEVTTPPVSNNNCTISQENLKNVFNNFTKFKIFLKNLNNF